MIKLKKFMWVGVLALLIALPLGSGHLFSDFYIALVLRIFIFGILLLGFDLLAGYGGLVSFGHAMFLGTGAYVAALVWKHMNDSVWLGILMGLLLNGLIGYFVGLLCVRTRAIYFVFLTFAFSQFFFVTANSWRLIGAADGIAGIPSPSLLPGIYLRPDGAAFYYFSLVCLIIAYWVAQRIVKSHFGQVLIGIRENEERAKFLGYDTSLQIRKVFLISGLFASLAGALMVILQPYASPHHYNWILSGDIVIMEILGGMGTLVGPLLGVSLVILVQDFVSSWHEQAWMFCVGAIYVLCVLYSPAGIMGIIKNISSHMWVFRK